LGNGVVWRIVEIGGHVPVEYVMGRDGPGLFRTVVPEEKVSVGHPPVHGDPCLIDAGLEVFYHGRGFLGRDIPCAVADHDDLSVRSVFQGDEIHPECHLGRAERDSHTGGLKRRATGMILVGIVSE